MEAQLSDASTGTIVSLCYRAIVQIPVTYR
jgi:hypothetical protein